MPERDRDTPQEPKKETILGSKTGFVFPGQGAQFVGMGLDLYNSSRGAKELLNQVDSALSMPLARIMFEGPESELVKTINSQPAIMATSLALLKALEEFGEMKTLKPAVLAGHSLGEYTCLVVSGALDLASGIRLVRERGRLMQEASEMRPGTMAAIIGLDEDAIKEVCRETGAEIANINALDQIVVSGSKECVARAIEMCSTNGARRAISLEVSGAFHSFLMSPAKEGLAKAIENAGIKDPTIPIVANTTSLSLTTAQSVKEELLDQLTSCVQWKKSVERMMDQGVVDFIEFGPGNVLGGLIKRISAAPSYKDRGVRAFSINSPESIQKFAGV